MPCSVRNLPSWGYADDFLPKDDVRPRRSLLNRRVRPEQWRRSRDGNHWNPVLWAARQRVVLRSQWWEARTLSAAAAHVLGPTTPSGGRLFCVCQVRVEMSVFGPKISVGVDAQDTLPQHDIRTGGSLLNRGVRTGERRRCRRGGRARHELRLCRPRIGECEDFSGVDRPREDARRLVRVRCGELVHTARPSVAGEPLRD